MDLFSSLNSIKKEIYINNDYSRIIFYAILIIKQRKRITQKEN